MARLIIRADGDSQMGTGHLMRSLGFAQYWLDGGDPVTLLTASCGVLRDRFESEGIQIVDIKAERASRDDGLQTHQVVEGDGDAVLMVDGPHFGDEFFETLRERSYPMVQVDDMGQRSHYHADVVLNQNLHAAEAMYSNRGDETCLCLGVDYILFRREIRRPRDEMRSYSKTVENLLVTMGGSDPPNATLAVLQALEEMLPEGVAVVVPVGAANPHFETLQNWAASTSLDVKLVRNVREMAPLFLAADLAISSGGTTVWELALFGVPTLVGVIADIENYLADGLRQHELFRLAGDFRSLDREILGGEFQRLSESVAEREQCGRHAAAFIDGQGVDRLKILCQNLRNKYKSNLATD